jgi:GrpB-like predicted nucleotidyltransferase (UPF0157 family)
VREPPGTLFRIQAIAPELLEAERRRVVALLDEAVPEAEVIEVGSTAIPGVIGKGDLDILVRCPADRFDETLLRLDACLPRNPKQFSSADYQGYVVPSPLDVALQVTVAGGPHDDFVPFVEALTADPDLVERYNQLKRTWDGRPMDAYREAKADFIQQVLAARQR